MGVEPPTLLGTREGAMNNPNKRPPPSSSAGTFEGGDGTKRSREAILRPGKDAPSNVLLVRISDIVHPVRGERRGMERRK